MTNCIVGKVLNEWAMRSPDGLSSEICSEDNLRALRETLSQSFNMSDSDVSDIVSGVISNISRVNSTNSGV